MSAKMTIPAVVVHAGGEGEGTEARRHWAAPAPGLAPIRGGPWSPSHVHGRRPAATAKVAAMVARCFWQACQSGEEGGRVGGGLARATSPKLRGDEWLCPWRPWRQR